MPPHAQFYDFLSSTELADFTDWAIANESRFKPAKVYLGTEGAAKINPEMRQALKLRNLGSFEPVLEERLLGHLPSIMSAVGYAGKEPRSIDFELNAYGEGAYFRPHMDIAVGRERALLGSKQDEDRVITAVFYFYREPKNFEGGALRLYRFGADASDIDRQDANSRTFEPVQNSLLVFPPWATHAVERVACPSGRFADYRFALNCWFCRPVEIEKP